MSSQPEVQHGQSAGSGAALPPSPLSGLGRLGASAASAGRRVLARGSAAGSFVTDETLRSVRAGLYLTSHFIDGQLLPTFAFLSDLGRDVDASWREVLAGRRGLSEHLGELARRLGSAARYESLVHGAGKELFGSASFAGEQTLAEGDVYRLRYLPPRPEVARQQAALFHLGGFIPYGDRIFRFLPEANLYDRYLERGIGVYAMELRGDRQQTPGLGSLTLDRLIDSIDELCGLAFAHNGGRKLIGGAYCGTGLQLICYLAARPTDAEAKLASVSLFVAPIDGRRCQILGELVANLPRTIFRTTFARSKFAGGYVNGVEMWAGLDTSLKAVFLKTSLGRFASGWKNGSYAGVREVAELSPAQRWDLAGAYWISVHNAERFPLPVELVRSFVSFFDQGVAADGDLHCSYRGRPLNLHAILEHTSLPIDGFYGGQDKIVQEDTAQVLGQIFGERYHHHVNQSAAHVSYICVPAQWRPGHPRSLLPNPIDVLLARYAER